MDKRPGICVGTTVPGRLFPHSGPGKGHKSQIGTEKSIGPGQPIWLRDTKSRFFRTRIPLCLGTKNFFCAGQSRPMPIFGQNTICEFSQKFLQIPGLKFLDKIFLFYRPVYKQEFQDFPGINQIIYCYEKSGGCFPDSYRPKKHT